MTKTSEWYLKKKNNTQYGPVSLPELLQWAKECRIVAGNQISQDRQNWTPVEDIPELEMDWFAERHDGKRYGPFPLDAVDALVEHRVLPHDAILTHRKNGKTLTMDDAMAKSKKIETDSPEVPEKDDSVSPLHSKAKADSKPPMSRKTENETGRMDGDSTTPSEVLHSGEPEKVAELQREITDLQKQIESLIQGREEQLNEAEEDVATLHAEFESFKTQAAEQHQEAYAYQQELAAQIEELQEELKKERDAQKQQISIDPQQEERIAELRQQVAFMKKNTAALHAQLTTAQQTATQRAKMLAIAWLVVTLVAAGLILSLFSHGCQRLDRPTTAPQSETESVSEANADAPQFAPETEPLTDIDIEGVEILSQDENSLSLRFDEGIFSSLDTLSEDGRQLLDAIARELPRGLEGWQLIIEGHTDDIPLRSTSRFENNEALAQARASTVAQHFQERAAYPEDAMTIRAGTTAPFPNDSRANRIRNRTVTLQVERP